MSISYVFRKLGCFIRKDVILFDIHPTLFRAKLARLLRSHPPREYALMITHIQEHTEDPIEFRKFLMPSQVKDTVPQKVRPFPADSLFKTLLAIDSIQTEIIAYLLKRLPEFYDELENDSNSSPTSTTARLILNQLRWLDVIDPEFLIVRLLLIAQDAPATFQHEMAPLVPEIINNPSYGSYAFYLTTYLSVNVGLTVAPMLEARFQVAQRCEITRDDNKIDNSNKLRSARLSKSVNLIKIWLEKATPTTIDQVVWDIRQGLRFKDFSSTTSFSSADNNPTRKVNKANKAPEAAILESIESGLQSRTFACEAWLKLIDALDKSHDHEPIDVMVLIVLYSMASMKKKAEDVVMNKVTQGYFTDALIKNTIVNHADGLAGYWGAISSLAESLSRASQQNNTLSPCASTMYISAFTSTDAYHRQEIVGALITHVDSDIEVVINVALNVLLELVKTDASSVATILMDYFKGMLEYLDDFSHHQICTLFAMFTLLAHTSDTDGLSTLWSEIQIIIQKHLSDPREKYKHIGVIASLSAVKVLGSKKLCNAFQDLDLRGGGGADDFSNNYVRLVMLAHAAAEQHPVLHRAIELLEFALPSLEEYPSSITLMYDGLAHLIREEDIDEGLEMWLKEKIVKYSPIESVWETQTTLFNEEELALAIEDEDSAQDVTMF